MAHEGETAKASTIDRSERPGHIGWVLLLATILVGAILSLLFLGTEQAQPLILGLLAFFAMAGVFFLFALAIGVIQLAGRVARPPHGASGAHIPDGASAGRSGGAGEPHLPFGPGVPDPQP